MKNILDEMESWRGRKSLAAVFPHPDDETMATAGVLAAAKRLGWETGVVVLTKGGAGQVHSHLNGKTLKRVRENELGKSGKILGVDYLESGDFDDGGLRRQVKQWRPWVRKMLAGHRPGWVVTYDHSGVTGHPDHIAVSVDSLGWPGRLWWATIPKEQWVLNPEVADYLAHPTHRLDLGWNWVLKWRAARAHKSQGLGKGLPVPLGLILAKYHYEWYHEVDPKGKYKFKYVDFEI